MGNKVSQRGGGEAPRSWSRLAWFVGLYLASMAVFWLAVEALRALLT